MGLKYHRTEKEFLAGLPYLNETSNHQMTANKYRISFLQTKILNEKENNYCPVKIFQIYEKHYC